MALIQIKAKPSPGYGEIAALLFGVAAGALLLALHIALVRP